MPSSILEDAVAGRAIIQPWTVEQYHFAVNNGLLAEDPAYELLDGFIVRKDRAKAGEDPMTIGDRHALVVQRLVRLAPQFDPFGCHLRIQQPVSLPPYSEPEPDGSVVRGTEDDYADRRPLASDAFCVIEVSDSSLARDLGTKLRDYSEAGIAHYVAVDLVHNVVLVHTNPSNGGYARVTPLHAGETLDVPTATGAPVAIAVARLLP